MFNLIYIKKEILFLIDFFTFLKYILLILINYY